MFKIVKKTTDNTLYAVVYDGVQYKMLVPAHIDVTNSTEITIDENLDEPHNVGNFNAAFEPTEMIYDPEE